MNRGRRTGYWREVGLFQLLAAAPLVMFYGRIGTDTAMFDFGYTPLAMSIYAGMLIALVLALKSVLRGPAPSPEPAA